MVSLLGLGSRLGDEIRVQASGPDAEEAIIQLSQAIRNGLGEACGKAQSCAATNATPLPEEQPLLGQTNDDPNTLSGVAASPGLAIGQVFQLVEETFEFAEQGTDVTTEQQQLSDAIEKAKQQQQTLKADVISHGSSEQAAIFDAHRELLNDPELTCKGAHKHGKWVGVCGGIASDTQAVPLLIGLGVDELSVSVPTLPAIKAQVRERSLSDCQSLAQHALTLETAAEVRNASPVR
ncbi:hypothetical protein DU002_06825 [Corallincola holothuriorum]|uniref:HPr domain-containing protein n=1 Tax=Corallincola holothuriorum TaxID=2282215 RepID=A0A368NMR5_9GAMM|nr:hypothetical protein DU002_06825 [Corallincola holothuriorum]